MANSKILKKKTALQNHYSCKVLEYFKSLDTQHYSNTSCTYLKILYQVLLKLERCSFHLAFIISVQYPLIN